MDIPSVHQIMLWPFVVYFFSVLLLIAFMLIVSYILGERCRDRLTAQPYESGILPTGSARMRFDVRYYLIAMFFVIFDLEAAFIYAWAVSFHESGLSGYISILIFIFVLMMALVYLSRLGILEWRKIK